MNKNNISIKKTMNTEDINAARRARFQKLYHQEDSKFKLLERSRYLKWYDLHKEEYNAMRRERRRILKELREQQEATAP